MENGLFGQHGLRVQSRVVEEANHEHARVQTLHHPLVAKTVKVLHRKQRCVDPLPAHHVSKSYTV